MYIKVHKSSSFQENLKNKQVWYILLFFFCRGANCNVLPDYLIFKVNLNYILILTTIWCFHMCFLRYFHCVLCGLLFGTLNHLRHHLKHVHHELLGPDVAWWLLVLAGLWKIHQGVELGRHLPRTHTGLWLHFLW